VGDAAGGAPVSAATPAAVSDDGRARVTTWTFSRAGATTGPAGTTHDVISTSGHEAVFVEIELKG
jgi:hypothetical protein